MSDDKVADAQSRLGPQGMTVGVEEFLADSVKLDDFALDEEMRRAPADIAYWNERYARAHKAHLLAKLEEDRTRARRRMEIKALAEAGPKGKAPTVEDMKAAVEADSEVYDATVRAIEAEVEKVRLRGVVDAVSAKIEMVRSLGAKLRIEMQNDPAVREQHSNARFGSRS